MTATEVEEILVHLRGVYALSKDEVVRNATRSLADLVRARAELEGQPEHEPAA
jgi:hypothetical protein